MDDLEPDHRKDPHRRLLRHTYQEGPGFLLLATRGGRPPGRAGQRDPANLRLRARAVRLAREDGVSAALALGVSRASLHRWQRWYAVDGLEGLVDRPRGPLPQRLPDWVEQAVIVVRLLTYWNSKRLAAEFTRREIYPLNHHAVDALLADLGTARPSSVGSAGRPTSERAPTSCGTSTSRARSSSSARRASSRRSGSSASSTTTAGSSSACASCPARRPSRSSSGSTTASSCVARRSS